jgi:hypothetical protein
MSRRGKAKKLKKEGNTSKQTNKQKPYPNKQTKKSFKNINWER